MTKISDLKFKTKVLSDEEKYSFNELDSVCTAVIKTGFPFEIIVVRMDERDFHEDQYVIIFIEKIHREPIRIDTVIPKEKLTEICPDNDSEISIDKINEETANKIIEIAEEFGKNVATYLDTIKTYSDRIFFISTTIQ